ncbi:hypothetical protein [Siphonobacter sp. SORGH_AS_1065]|uniref:hypothetical protein n=1 Tax=Siphonobacter sp. SORGH_AS_1065 TaxID=3041795 RepID=UPI00277DF46C|nr:hypothetical protein [Siphonobacter sp. SORGH_AS_1065]MDQ1090124.1 hypothetical protein [Siphonobacter sp. SORGH_AS_1065]
MKFLKYLFFFLSFPIITHAHVGSSGVVYEGKAGKYPVQVFVQPPDVIPGTAQVTVMVGQGTVESIQLKPIYFSAGDEGSPQADPALPAPGEPGQFQGSVWFMETGSASVQVTIKGSLGTGTVVIPMVAVSTATRQMPEITGWVLVGLGVLLIGLLITIFGASVSDGLMKPGQADTAQTRRKRVTGSIVGATFCFGLIFIGNNWWKDRANEYKDYLYKPYRATSSVHQKEGQSVLTLQIDSNSVQQRSLSYLVPDHGKLMHLFLVRQGTMDAFAHLHPNRLDSLTFQAPLPDLPPGKYLLYADMVRYHGFSYTVTDTLEIPVLPKTQTKTLKSDPEDTFAVTSSITKTQPLLGDQNITICGKPGVKTKLQDGSTIVWEAQPNQTFQSGKVYSLNFSVIDPNGKSAALQPYLGMMGHAAVFKNDGQVYIHLHPTGTFSSASQQILENRITETRRLATNPAPPKVFRDSVDQVIQMLAQLPEAARDHLLMPNMDMASMGGMEHGQENNHLSIPYAFPQSGDYRIWIQVKRNNKVLTGVFDASVK